MAQTTVTHLKRLYIGSNPDNISNTLSDGQMEVEGALYLIDALSVGSTLGVTGAATLSSTLAVTSTSTLTGLVTATTGVSIGGRIILSSTIMGRNVFNGESTTDDVTLAGVQSGDTILAFPYGTSVTSGDVLSAVASGTGGAFTVSRPSGGTSGLTYAYIVLRPA